jgi:hypothetical protein
MLLNPILNRLANCPTEASAFNPKNLICVHLGMVHDQGNTSDTQNFPIQAKNGTPPCKGGWGDFSTVFIECYLNSNGK